MTGMIGVMAVFLARAGLPEASSSRTPINLAQMTPPSYNAWRPYKNLAQLV
jgi:hypothetical protein